VQLRSVVIGMDFSDVSLRAARWIASHIAPEAELVFVHVIPGPRLPSYVRSRVPGPGAIAVDGATALRNCLHGIAESLGPGRARVELLSGPPAEALAFVADEIGADLICIGRGSRRHGSARFGATTPLRLLAWTRVPTLVAPSAVFGTPSRLVAGVDDRAGGAIVFDVACEWASTFGARLEAVHVIESEIETFVAAARQFTEEADCAGPMLDSIQRRRGQAHVAWLRDRARDWVAARLRETCIDERCAGAIVCSGDPGQELVRHARVGRSELILLGRGGDLSHADVPAGSLKLGSTARLVLWAAACPVLVLPTDSLRRPVDTPTRGTRERSRLLEFRPGHGSRNGKVGPPFPAALLETRRRA
jgi:nucleotide-binding universal stress UspA family protein